MNQHFFVTGALGCIGAWVVRNLVNEGIPVTVFDLDSNPHRLKLIMAPGDLEKIHFINGGDITNLAAVERGIKETGATHIIHLAALQVPFCRADPSKGAMVNVVGTVNIFEGVKRAGLKRVVYASSVAVYGPEEEFKIIGNDAPFGPRNHYGVYKQANEGTARIYWQDDGISSIGVRPYTLYGPGRDQGMTSYPTQAMLAAAAGEGFHIPFGGYNGFQYADDVAKILIQAARAPFEGAEVFNLRGSVAHMSEVVSAIDAAAPEVKGQITFDDKPLALPAGTEDSALIRAIGPVADTSLREGVAATVTHFRTALADGRIAFKKS